MEGREGRGGGREGGKEGARREEGGGRRACVWLDGSFLSPRIVCLMFDSVHSFVHSCSNFISYSSCGRGPHASGKQRECHPPRRRRAMQWHPSTHAHMHARMQALRRVRSHPAACPYPFPYPCPPPLSPPLSPPCTPPPPPPWGRPPWSCTSAAPVLYSWSIFSTECLTTFIAASGRIPALFDNTTSRLFVPLT